MKNLNVIVVLFNKKYKMTIDKKEVIEWIDNCLVIDYKLGMNRDVNIKFLKKLIRNIK